MVLLDGYREKEREREIIYKGYLNLYRRRIAVSIIAIHYLRYFSRKVVQAPWKYDSFISKTSLKTVI
jgi:hypothetical protein